MPAIKNQGISHIHSSISSIAIMSHLSWPEFDALPLDPNGPPGNAWGLFGKDDQLGMLNLLTPEVVASAAAEIKHGIRISLDWPMDKPGFPTGGRKRFHHRVIHHPEIPMNDDEVHLNTQSSTQWDGFRHFGLFGVGWITWGKVADGDSLSINEAVLQWSSTGRFPRPWKAGHRQFVPLGIIIPEHSVC